ncbi:MAG: cytochrome c3 family protein [Nitrospirota bacterium]
MKKLIILIAAILLTFSAAYADNVSNTDHNLVDTANPYDTSSTDEVCVFCHTPHGGTTDAPLWNRNYTPGAFTMYDSPTLDMAIAGTPESVSAACLSCHDGTTAFDSLINEPGAGSDTIGTWTWAGGNNKMDGTISPVAYLGTDLSNDHPISIAYNVGSGAGQDPDFNAIVNNYVGSLPLYPGSQSANQVECGSCHNPHEDILVNFLRISNAASAMCVSCHIK